VANYSSKDLVIQFDDSGGTLRTMTQYIREINGVKVEAILADSHSFGDTWFETLATGLKKMGDVTMGGFYDDTSSTGPDAVFIGIGNTTTRTLTLTWGGTKTTSVETVILSYERTAKVGDMTMFQVVVRPTGTVTEA
jgi:hypothetical protein